MLFDSAVYLAAHLEEPGALDRVMQHWPGALTAIVRARGDSSLVPPVVTAEGTIGVRKPDDVHARAVIRACGGLLAVDEREPSWRGSGNHRRRSDGDLRR